MNENGKLIKLSLVGFGKTKHSHIAYIDETTGEGLCSLNNKHTHQLTYTPPQQEIPEQPEYQDPETGEIIPAQPGQPAIEGGWEVTPDPIDGHTHEMEMEIELEDFDQRAKDEEGNLLSEEDVTAEVWELWKESRGLEDDSLKKSQEAEDFYFGDQWDSRLANTLKSQGRAVLTKNFSQKYLDDLCGVVREERKEFRYSPTEGGDKACSDILTFLSKSILNKCYYQRERAKFFEDMSVRGKAVFNLKVDFTTNLEGEIIVERFPGQDITFGPFEKEDLSDLEYLNKDRLYSLAKLKQEWPDKAKEVTKDFKAYAEKFGEADTHVDRKDAYATAANRAPYTWEGYKNIDILRKEIRVLECWRRTYLSAPVALSPERDFYQNCYGWSRADIKSLKTIPGFAVIDRVIPKIRITKVAGNVLLSDENPADLPVDDFFVSVGYCKRRDNRYVGKMELAKDSQMEINKRASQAIDIGNKMATYVQYIDQTIFVDEKEELRFMEQSNSPGTVFRLNSVDRKPVRDEGAQFPSGIVQLMELNKADLRELLNTSVEPWGANTSGNALMSQQRTVLRGNQFLFDNLEFAEQRLGRLLIPIIQRYYSPSRIARLVMSAPGKEEVDIDGTPLTEFTQEDIEALLMTKDLAANDVEVTQGVATPTIRTATNMLLTDLAKSGYQVPPAALIRYSDLPKAEQDRFMADITQMNEQAGSAQSATRNMEIEKTLIAQGMVPPAVAQEFGVSAPNMNPAPPTGGLGSGGGPLPLSDLPTQ